MSSTQGRRLAGGFMVALLVILPACHQSQLQTARVISEAPGLIVVAMPENTPDYRKKAERIAQDKLGKSYVMVEGKEVTTTDNVGKEITQTGFIKPDKKTKEEVYRREYHVTFKRSGNSEN
jgi:hypothetical protein